MEMILISSNKLKIIMSKAELEKFYLTTDILDYQNTETKRMLWDLLFKAKRTAGFDPDGYRVFVQLYPSKDGSCELFVTKIIASDKSICDMFSSNEEEYDENEDVSPEYDRCEDIDERKKCVVFAMDSLDALSDACRRLVELSFSSESSVYIFNGTFYLLLFVNHQYINYPIDEFSFLGEYGTPNLSKEIFMNLYEFGKVIREGDAIKTFAEL